MKKGISFFFYPLLMMGVILAFANSCNKDEANKKEPVITWSDPADITFGTVLSTTQLNATADIPGTFVYTPPLGTKLNERLNQVLKVAFTPTDGSVYKTVNKTIKINVVNPVNPVILQMVNIPAGTFTMGSPASEVGHEIDEIEHKVTLSAFKMSKYEITNAQFAAFLNARSIGSSGSDTTDNIPGRFFIARSNNEGGNWGLAFIANTWVPVTGYENHPVINVTWYGAKEFAI